MKTTEILMLSAFAIYFFLNGAFWASNHNPLESKSKWPKKLAFAIFSVFFYMPAFTFIFVCLAIAELFKKKFFK